MSSFLRLLTAYGVYEILVIIIAFQSKPEIVHCNMKRLKDEELSIKCCYWCTIMIS